MQDPLAEDILKSSSQKKLQKWLGGSQIGRRLLLGLIFFISLTLFLHFRQVRMEVLEVGALAPRYIIGQTDFSFPDDEATKILKTEAVRDIGSIYKIDEKKIRKFRAAFEYDLVHYQR